MNSARQRTDCAAALLLLLLLLLLRLLPQQQLVLVAASTSSRCARTRLAATARAFTSPARPCHQAPSSQTQDMCLHMHIIDIIHSILYTYASTGHVIFNIIDRYSLTINR